MREEDAGEREADAHSSVCVFITAVCVFYLVQSCSRGWGGESDVHRLKACDRFQESVGQYDKFFEEYWLSPIL